MNLVLLEPHEVLHDGQARLVVLRDHRATHLREVLKVTLGASVRVGLVGGAMGHASVSAIDDGSITLRVEDLSIEPTPSRVDLLLCLPRPKVLARLLSPIAQLGEIGRAHV